MCDFILQYFGLLYVSTSDSIKMFIGIFHSHVFLCLYYGFFLQLSWFSVFPVCCCWVECLRNLSLILSLDTKEIIKSQFLSAVNFLLFFFFVILYIKRVQLFIREDTQCIACCDSSCIFPERTHLSCCCCNSRTTSHTIHGSGC